MRCLLPQASCEAMGSTLGLGQEIGGVEALGFGGSLDMKIEKEEKEALRVSAHWEEGGAIAFLGS